jgi:hypothetical protein
MVSVNISKGNGFSRKENPHLEKRRLSLDEEIDI